MIFDNRTRTRDGGAREGEPHFAYIDQSARPEAARIRALLNAMATRYPAADRDALIARIRTERFHIDAFFELFVHEWCLHSRMRVLAVEPDVPGTTKKPDFLVETEGRLFYLECAVARGESDADAAARSRRDDVLRTVDTVDSPDFLLAINAEGAPEDPVPLRALEARITRWLATLDYAEIAASTPDAAPVFEEDLNGMALRLRPIARQRTRGEGGGSATGILSDGIRVSAPWIGMREPLIRKAGRYGRPDLPLVVALNALDRDARLEHVMDTLYGTQGWTLSDDGSGQPTRMPDGVWHGPRGPQCTRLSAVLVADRLSPWTLGQRDAMFIENLWATRPASFIDFRVASWRLSGEELRYREGTSLQDVFCVPTEWPERKGATSDP